MIDCQKKSLQTDGKARFVLKDYKFMLQGITRITFGLKTLIVIMISKLFRCKFLLQPLIQEKVN